MSNTRRNNLNSKQREPKSLHKSKIRSQRRQSVFTDIDVDDICNFDNWMDDEKEFDELSQNILERLENEKTGKNDDKV